MKNIILAVVIIFCATGVTEAHDRKPIFFQSVSVFDVMTGMGLYIKDVGCKTVKGTKGVLRGTGEILTSPFRGKLSWPTPRVFRYERGFWVPPRLKEISTDPLDVELGEPIKLEGLIYLPHQVVSTQAQ